MRGDFVVSELKEYGIYENKCPFLNFVLILCLSLVIFFYPELLGLAKFPLSSLFPRNLIAKKEQ